MQEIILSTTDIQQYCGADTTFKPENLSGPAKMKAATEIKDIISPAVYDLAVAHANRDVADDPEPLTPRITLLNQLVELVQGPFVNLTMYYQFIWLNVRVSSNTLSTMKSDREQPLNKGERIEAKESLLEYAWSYINELVDFLNANSDNITDVEAVDPVEGEEPVVPIKIWEVSSQYLETKNLIFEGHRDFGRYYGIDNCAAFYYRCRTLIQSIIEDNVDTRLTIADDTDPKIIRAVKTAMAYETVGRACTQLPISSLPGSIRQTIDKEGYGNSKEEDTVRMKIARTIMLQAENAWAKLDTRIAETSDDGNGNITIADNVPAFDETLKHASIL
jgi:hypothetical protein